MKVPIWVGSLVWFLVGCAIGTFLGLSIAYMGIKFL